MPRLASSFPGLVALSWTVLTPQQQIATAFVFRRSTGGGPKMQARSQQCSIISRLASSEVEGQDAAVDAADPPPDFVTSPVLLQVYPALLTNIATFGHPNIPLGSTDGRRCKTLRRLAFEKKLSSHEMDLLTELGFRFNSLEDVYEEADFDDCLSRLVQYEQEFKTGYQIPKKYEPDPELGAWVTMIRRIGRDSIEEDRRTKLDKIGFAWVSTRKCGSAFMRNYRGIRDRLSEGGRVAEEVLDDEEATKWLRAQMEAEGKGNLSQDRVDYLDKLNMPGGIGWRDV